MIKGVKKSVIVVDPPTKSSFEKIFFVMKTKQAASGSQDMLTEANRIIAESLGARSVLSRRRNGYRRWLAFGVGFVAGVTVGILIAVLAI